MYNCDKNFNRWEWWLSLQFYKLLNLSAKFQQRAKDFAKILERYKRWGASSAIWWKFQTPRSSRCMPVLLLPRAHVSSSSDKHCNCIQLCLTMVKTSSILNLNMKIQWKPIFFPLSTHEHLAKFLTIIDFPILRSLLMSFHSEHLLSPLKMCHKTYLSTFTICQGWGECVHYMTQNKGSSTGGFGSYVCQGGNSATDIPVNEMPEI